MPLRSKIAGRFLFATPDGVMTKVKIGGKFNITERRGGVGSPDPQGLDGDIGGVDWGADFLMLPRSGR